MKHKVHVKGVIISNDEEWIYDMFEIEATSPRKVSKAIEEAEGKDLEVLINSGGGSVWDASEIYTELKSYQGDVETRIVGLAASAASVIAMGGNKTLIAPTGQLMIHNASVRAQGDYHTMDKTSEFLKSVNSTISNAYKLKSGMEETEILRLMDEESWLTPQQALEYGLVDEIMFEESIKTAASTSNAVEIPQAIINGIKKGALNKVSNKGESGFVKEDQLKQMFEEFKNEIKTELKNESNKEKEPSPELVKNSNLGMAFIKSF